MDCGALCAFRAAFPSVSHYSAKAARTHRPRRSPYEVELRTSQKEDRSLPTQTFRKTLSALLLPVCILLLVGPSKSQLPPETWSQFRGSHQAIGVSVSNVPRDLKLVWTYEAGESIESSAAIVNGAVYVGFQQREHRGRRQPFTECCEGLTAQRSEPRAGKRASAVRARRVRRGMVVHSICRSPATRTPFGTVFGCAGVSRSRGRSIGTVRRQRADSLLGVTRRPCGDDRPLRSLPMPFRCA